MMEENAGFEYAELARKISIHIRAVGCLLETAANELFDRIINHDSTRLDDIEWESNLRMSARLSATKFGSPEYYKCREEISDAVQHHYSNNRHHPEHFARGVNDMNLIDLLEMLADWVCSSNSQNEGSIENSLEINKFRFDVSDQLHRILCNTVRDLSWDGDQGGINQC